MSDSISNTIKIIRMDFRLKDYLALIDTFTEYSYTLFSYLKYLENKAPKFVILRHDVDKRPDLALKMAQAEFQRGISATYYFRIKRISNDPKIITQISQMGHEIGYHYEDLALARGNYELAINTFEKHLAYFRQFYPVKTICMHGSPISKWDNKSLWEKYNYHNYGLLSEPYIELSTSSLFYLTDTGRRWNGDSYSVRDRLANQTNNKYHTTYDIIKACKKEELPAEVLITTHPQRWSTNFIDWSIELVMQNTKNIIKRRLAKLR